jgi:hypothetical protein
MKRLYIFILFFSVCLVGSFKTFAQAVTCDPNIDFALGTFQYWDYYYGDYTAGDGNSAASTSTTPNTNPYAISSHTFTVTSGNGTDPYGGFPVVDPLHTYSLKLGADIKDYKAEKAVYLIHVPAGVNNYALFYRFAVVFEDPTSGHTDNEKPRFMVTTKDPSNNIISCGTMTYIAGANMPGFVNSNVTSVYNSNGTDVWYRDWSTAALNLSGYAGQNITVEFEADDCSKSGHFGYAYLNVDCGTWDIQKISCDYNSTTTLAAPPGFSSYDWYDVSNNLLGHGQTFTFNTPNTTSTYHVTCNPYTGYGCTQTLTTTLVISPLSLTLSNNTTICNGSSVGLTASGSGTATPLAYNWTPSGSLSCQTCTTPNASPTSTTTYNVKVTDANNCFVSSNVTVNVDNPVSITTQPTNQTACENTTVSFSAAATGSTGLSWQVSTDGGATYTNLGVTSSPLSFTCNASQNGNMYRAVFSTNSVCGAATSNAVTLTVNTVPVMTTNISGTLATCSGSNISLTTGASGSPSPSLIWQQSSNGGVSYTTIPGATSNNYNVTATVGLNNYKFRSQYSNTCGTATSNAVTVTVNASVTPTISIGANTGTTICAGTNVTFTAMSTNGGSSPIYQWKKNGSPVGSNSNTYSDNGLNNGDAITCDFTSNAVCASPLNLTSNSLAFTVNAAPPQQGAFTASSSTTFKGQVGVAYTVANIGGATFNWAYSGSGITVNGSGNSVTVDFSQSATSGNFCVNTTTVHGCNSTPTCVAVTVKPYTTWGCTANNDWHNGANWDCGFEPYGTISCYIPAGTNCDPFVSNTDGNCYDLRVDKNANVNIDHAKKLHCNNDLHCDGRISGDGYLHHTSTTCHVVYGRGRVDNYELDNSCGGQINSGDTLHIGKTYLPTLGTMTCNGELELLSDATGTACILHPPVTNNSYISGNVICDRFIAGGRRAYRFFGHPFTTSIGLSQLEQYIDITGQGGSANGFTNTTTNNPSSFWYNTLTGNGSSIDDNTGWIPFTNCDGNGVNAWNEFEGTRIMVRGTPGQGLGCNLCVPQDVTVKLRGPIHQGDVSTTCQTNANVGYNFISNPYPCDIDLSTCSRESKIGNNFSVWDPHQGSVGAYVTQPFSFSYILPSSSAFFVTCTDVTNNHISFHETDKTTADASDHVFKTTSGFGSDVLQLRILSNSDSLSWDRLLLFFNNQANSATDNFDGLKIMNPDLSFYTIATDNNTLAVDFRPYVPTQVIPLGLINAPQNTYSIRVDDYSIPGNGYVYLHDKYLNQIQLLNANTHYDFSVTSDTLSQGNNRFELNFTNAPLEINTLSGTATFNAQIVPNPATDMIAVSFAAPQPGNTTISITNLLGQEMYSNNMGMQQSAKVSIPLSNYANGMYIVNIHCGNQQKVIRFAKQ